MEVYPPSYVKHMSTVMDKMQASIVLFELHGPREARAKSEHGGKDDGGSMLLELQAFLQPLAVLCHVQLPLLGSTRYP